MKLETFFLLSVLFHLASSIILYLGLSGLVRSFKLSNEFKSWLWLTACFCSFLIPLQVLITELDIAWTILVPTEVTDEITTGIVEVNPFIQVVTDYPPISQLWSIFETIVVFLAAIWAAGTGYLFIRLVNASYQD